MQGLRDLRAPGCLPAQAQQPPLHPGVCLPLLRDGGLERQLDRLGNPETQAAAFTLALLPSRQQLLAQRDQRLRETRLRPSARSTDSPSLRVYFRTDQSRASHLVHETSQAKYKYVFTHKPVSRNQVSKPGSPVAKSRPWPAHRHSTTTSPGCPAPARYATRSSPRSARQAQSRQSAALYGWLNARRKFQATRATAPVHVTGLRAAVRNLPQRGRDQRRLASCRRHGHPIIAALYHAHMQSIGHLRQADRPFYPITHFAQFRRARNKA